MLTAACDAGASDLHLCSGSPPMARVLGDIQELPVPGADSPTLDPQALDSLILPLLNDDQKRRYEEDLELDFALQLEGVGRFRANLFHQLHGPAAVFRHIPAQIPSFEDLGLPAVVSDLVRQHSGLVLVTGPTGSGKSTTLAAMVDQINATRAGHIITIEDPVEFIHRSRRCIVNHREVGAHTRSFAAALRAALREDPDVILVGEMRDLETIALAITAAETGHLVLGTLHTTSALRTVDRIVDVFPSSQQDQIRTMLAGSLRGVISQALLRRADTPGRVAAVEVLLVNSAVRSLIRDGKTFQLASIIQTGRQQGMQSLDHDLKRLVLEGMTSLEEAATHTEEPERLTDTRSPPVASGGQGSGRIPAMPAAAGSRFGR